MLRNLELTAVEQNAPVLATAREIEQVEQWCDRRRMRVQIEFGPTAPGVEVAHLCLPEFVVADARDRGELLQAFAVRKVGLGRVEGEAVAGRHSSYSGPRSLVGLHEAALDAALHVRCLCHPEPVPHAATLPCGPDILFVGSRRAPPSAPLLDPLGSRSLRSGP